MFTPQLRDRLAKDLLASREAQEDLELQKRMMTHRYLPKVRDALMAGCRAAVAGVRCQGLKDLLACMQLSRIDMSEVAPIAMAILLGALRVSKLHNSIKRCCVSVSVFSYGFLFASSLLAVQLFLLLDSVTCPANAGNAGGNTMLMHTDRYKQCLLQENTRGITLLYIKLNSLSAGSQILQSSKVMG